MWKQYDRGGGMVVEAQEVNGKTFSRDEQTLLVMGINWLEWEEAHQEGIPDKLFADNVLDEYYLDEEDWYDEFIKKYAEENKVLGIKKD